jgi:hypothetical protein
MMGEEGCMCARPMFSVGMSSIDLVLVTKNFMNSPILVFFNLLVW